MISQADILLLCGELDATRFHVQCSVDSELWLAWGEINDVMVYLGIGANIDHVLCLID